PSQVPAPANPWLPIILTRVQTGAPKSHYRTQVPTRLDCLAAPRPQRLPESPAAPPEEQDGAGPTSDPPTPPEAASAALELPAGPAPLGFAPLADAAPRSPPSPGCSRPGPETFRQRFRQFRYQDAAGPREAFRQLRELSRQWLRPDIRTKEQIVEMLVQEQLLAILPEAADVRITG
uniref:SCAN domain-containing protein 1 n=1 Tax=Loxodonta africana TaxID=9785 RepID=G3UGE0_LOXAF